MGGVRSGLDVRRGRLWFEDGVVAQTLAFALFAIATSRMVFVALL